MINWRYVHFTCDMVVHLTVFIVAAAIESEMRHQKAALSKQREDYMKKAGILKKELDTLKDQRNELRGDAKRSPSPDTKRFLKENTKLQVCFHQSLRQFSYLVYLLILSCVSTAAHEASTQLRICTNNLHMRLFLVGDTE